MALIKDYPDAIVSGQSADVSVADRCGPHQLLIDRYRTLAKIAHECEQRLTSIS
jgi:hypothetical protein